jgi:ADP-ribose pyrophosphatase
MPKHKSKNISDVEKRLFEDVISRERMYKGKYLHLDRLTVRVPNGASAEREIVRVRDAVAVLPVDAEGSVHLVRQYRPAIGRILLEVPAGLIDPKEGKRAAAVRECGEETGFRPNRLRKLIAYAHAEGYSDGFITLFLGTDLARTGGLHTDPNEFVEPVTMPFDELVGLVRSNQILDSKTILCALLYEKMRKGE